ncbi:Light-regulated protein [Zea mays]|uniref:Light-regulated protein n=2 Tax=Zea mays TaxID=4577 RepID=A0A3L6G322_MAIZE|nr:CCR-like [Zea mays]PWZ40814.1 Light-regulated protein [Zea mays]
MCSHQGPVVEKSTVVVSVPVVVMVETAEIDYNSSFSVFTMEAYDLLDGDACNAQIYSVASAVSRRVEKVERDYLSYDEPRTVFTMEAYDLLDGDACNAQIYSVASAVSRRVEKVERDYLSYDEPRTVFSGEVCNDLGGEFCDVSYHADVFRELAQT